MYVAESTFSHAINQQVVQTTGQVVFLIKMDGHIANPTNYSTTY